MNKKIILLILCLFMFCSCSKQEKKPFGAESIDYDKVENINKNGPVALESHPENVPPMADKKTIIENGPPQTEYPNIKVEPTADMDKEPDYGGIPVIVKEPKD